MVETEQILRDFGLIVGAALLSQAVAALLRLPEMVMLVAMGALIGPSALVRALSPLSQRLVRRMPYLFSPAHDLTEMVLHTANTNLFPARSLSLSRPQ